MIISIPKDASSTLFARIFAILNMRLTGWSVQLLLVLCCIPLSGCAIGTTTKYQGGFSFKPELPPTVGAIIVGVQDERSSVVQGEKSETTVGIQRSIAGVPWPVRTESGRPLAFDLGESLVHTFQQHNYPASQVSVAPHSSEEDLLSRVATADKNSKGTIFHFLVSEWNNDVWITPTFTYCVRLKVRSLEGAVLGTSSQCGKEGLGPSKPGYQNLATAIGTIFGRLVNSAETKAALESPATIATPKKVDAIVEPKTARSEITTTKCTTKQVLQMKTLGLTDGQIAAACPH